jgi:hypothetical protein
MKRFNELINETNSNRIKKYYNLSQLEELTGMSIRALKYRMLDVKEKYKYIPSLLAKKNRQWQIHYTIVKEFEPKYNTKTKTIYTYNWVSMATWNPLYNYDIKYHVEVVNQIKKELPDNTILYSVEADNRNINHTHIVSDADTDELNKAVTSTLKRYIENEKEIRVLVESVYNKFSTIEYIKKAPLTSGVL